MRLFNPTLWTLLFWLVIDLVLLTLSIVAGLHDPLSRWGVWFMVVVLAVYAGLSICYIVSELRSPTPQIFDSTSV